MNCPACGAPAPEGARFCAECGQRLIVAADERRLVTVLMADLVGFTALSAGSDPEQVKRLVDACFEALVADIVAFGGHLDKIVGDEIVAMFGAPVAHEDDAERAVRAALRMHGTLAALAPDLGIRVQMRIGVNTGEVLVGAMRAGGEATVMGDVVNTASRLEKLADPGDVIVGPATYAATRASIRYDALGPQGLRGRAQPVASYQATDAPECERMVEGLLYLMDGVTRPGVDPTRACDDALRSTIAFFEALASRGPLVLTLSDLHWASDEALELCDRMLARLHDRPFVLVATTRPGLEDRWKPAPGTHNELALHLDPLDRDSTAALVRALFCGDADDETVEFLLERSGGNPFFVEELVAFVQETRDSDRLHALPATLHGLVAARLDALAPAERSLLEDCAIVGGSGPIAAGLALAARPDARRMLDDLAERDFLLIDHDEFHFKSELIREIAYGTLTKAERARRHALVAPVLASRGDQAAHHLATAAELVEELGSVDGVPADVRAQAVDALMRAAERDESVESWLRSERHHDRALALLGSENTQA